MIKRFFRVFGPRGDLRRFQQVAAALCLGVWLFHPQAAVLANTPPEVTVLSVAQRPGTMLVDVYYDVADNENELLTVLLQFSEDGGVTFPITCTSVSGDVGAGILPGSGKHIIWDAGADYPEHAGDDYRISVTASDTALPPSSTVPAGTFIMGSPPDEPGHLSDEAQHEVTLTHPFWIQGTEVTNQQYLEMAQWALDNGYATATVASLRDALDGSTQELLDLDGGYSEIAYIGGVLVLQNTGHGISPDHPVKEVTWYGAVAYCDWLSLQEGLPRAYNHATWQCNANDPYAATGYRLPTEAEWEYACRAGSVMAFANGPITYLYCTPLDPLLTQIGWYCGNAGGWTHLIAQKIGNSWGLYEMHGNLWEWCNDWYANYPVGPVTDPVGPPAGSDRMLRGGGWSAYAWACRSATRGFDVPGISVSDAGFRPVRSAG